jgi:hypothetical protein
MRSGELKRFVRGGCAVVGLLGVVGSAPAGAFTEVYQSSTGTSESPHSTFHYELVRTLVRAAGLPAEAAEPVAMASEATDLGHFTNASGVTVRFSGTERNHIEAPEDGELPDQPSQYWHMARRACTDSRVLNGVSHPAANVTGAHCNTCTYFSDTEDACEGGAELPSIDRWGLYSESSSALRFPAPVYPDGTQVPAGSLHAFGIYVHSLADSYSHEKCMMTEKLRVHPPPGSALDQSAGPECSGAQWHLGLEFTAEGNEYVKVAAVAIYRAAVKYRALKYPQECVHRAESWVTDVFLPSYLSTNLPEHRASVARNAFTTIKDWQCAP